MNLLDASDHELHELSAVQLALRIGNDRDVAEKVLQRFADERTQYLPNIIARRIHATAHEGIMALLANDIYSEAMYVAFTER